MGREAPEGDRKHVPRRRPSLSIRRPGRMASSGHRRIEIRNDPSYSASPQPSSFSRTRSEPGHHLNGRMYKFMGSGEKQRQSRQRMYQRRWGMNAFARLFFDGKVMASSADFLSMRRGGLQLVGAAQGTAAFRTQPRPPCRGRSDAVMRHVGSRIGRVRAGTGELYSA